MRLQPRFCLSVCRRYLLILGSCGAQAESNRTIRGSASARVGDMQRVRCNLTLISATRDFSFAVPYCAQRLRGLCHHIVTIIG